jgi:type 1 fimbriae regulatory protein FimB/type 1 fimbriae regulatory protein FimE
MPKTSRQISFSAKSFQKPPTKPKNKDQRQREYLTDQEVEQLRKAALKQGRNGLRDDTLILIMFRHALRVSEVIALRWEQVDLKKGLLHVNRRKHGLPSTHPLRGIELRALRQLQRNNTQDSYVFMSERQTPLTNRTVHHIIARAGKAASLPFTVHPHMLRHSTGFYLANHGHDTRAIQSYLGHANIKNTVIYTELAPNRFKNFWQD